MPDFRASDGVRLNYFVWGEAGDRPPVFLHHGFAASALLNWHGTGVVQALLDGGRQAIAIDARGHGGSDAPTDPALYGEVRLAKDVGELLDHLGVSRIDLAGYSMGAITALIFASGDDRVRRLWIGGVGEAVIDLGGVETRLLPPGALIAALEADQRPADMHPGVAEFRIFAERTGGHLKALAAQARSLHAAPIALDMVRMPTRLVVGDQDPLARNPQRLADALPDAELIILPGTHLGVCSIPQFAESIVAFVN